MDFIVFTLVLCHEKKDKEKMSLLLFNQPWKFLSLDFFAFFFSLWILQKSDTISRLVKQSQAVWNREEIEGFRECTVYLFV